METRITATELSRKLGDVFGRVRYRGDSFLIERSGVPVARLLPVLGARLPCLRDAVAIWREAGTPEPGFADDLDRVGALDRAPANRWGS